jgi:acetoin utilization deacetylase AcuC-like enzyme
MIAFYSEKHQRHAPKYEYLHGRLIPYAEAPQRIDSILTVVEAVEWDEPMPQEALQRVHNPRMLAYLESTSNDIDNLITHEAEAYQPDQNQKYVYPSVFPVRGSMHRLHGHPFSPHGQFFFDTEAPIGKGTWEAARASASLAYAAAEAVRQGQTRVSYALCRPPGHHAGSDFMGGYCYLNNAAVAAMHLPGKTSIIDVDYHHGNGTQDIVWDNPDLMFLSIHGHPDFDYPYYSGYEDETGAHQNVVNKPLPVGTDDAAYLDVLDEGLAAVRDFGAESLVISLGFDTYVDDTLGTFDLSVDCFRLMAEKLASLGLPTVVIQEGGYDVESLPTLVQSFWRGFKP